MFLQKSQMFITSTQEKPQPRVAVAHPLLLSIAGSLSELYSYHYILGVKLSMPRKSLGFAHKTYYLHLYISNYHYCHFFSKQEKNHKLIPM